MPEAGSFVFTSFVWELHGVWNHFILGRDLSFHGSATFDVSLFVQHIQCVALI